MSDSLVWAQIVQLFTTLNYGDRMLAITIMPGKNGWGALAIEGPAGEKSFEAVLANHAHEMIGEFRDQESALAAAEEYARKWKDRAALAMCACTSITKH